MADTRMSMNTPSVFSPDNNGWYENERKRKEEAKKIEDPSDGHQASLLARLDLEVVRIMSQVVQNLSMGRGKKRQREGKELI